MIDQNIFVGLLVALANSLNEIIAFKDLRRGGGDPHKGFWILGKQVKLTCTLKDEDAATDIVGKLLSEYL